MARSASIVAAADVVVAVAGRLGCWRAIVDKAVESSSGQLHPFHRKKADIVLQNWVEPFAVAEVVLVEDHIVVLLQMIVGKQCVVPAEGSDWERKFRPVQCPLPSRPR